MDQPELYRSYTYQEAVELFGPGEQARRVCGGQWVIFPEAALCLTRLGNAPEAPHFDGASWFRWVADAPYRVSQDPSLPSIPDETRIGKTESRKLHLFVESGVPSRYRYLGELEPYGLRSGGEIRYGMQHFRLRPFLPSSVWHELAGFRLEDLDPAPIDAALARLGQPGTPEDRWEILRRLVEYRHGAVRPEDGIPPEELAGLRMPDALRRWYAWAGRRSDEIFGDEGYLVRYDCLEPVEWPAAAGGEELAVFYSEDPSSYEWATYLEGEDPPVYSQTWEPEEAWEPAGTTVTEHLILASLYAAASSRAPYGASSRAVTESQLTRLSHEIPPLPLQPAHWGGSKRFYAGGGLFMVSAPSGVIDGEPRYQVEIGAWTEHPLQRLRSYVDETWDCADV